jgi:chromosome segregation ATPase
VLLDQLASQVLPVVSALQAQQGHKEPPDQQGQLATQAVKEQQVLQEYKATLDRLARQVQQVQQAHKDLLVTLDQLDQQVRQARLALQALQAQRVQQVRRA